MTDDFRRPLLATLTQTENDVALGRAPAAPWEHRVLTERILDEGVPSTAADADARQIHPPQESASQPTIPLTRAEQIAELEHRVMLAETAREYEIAQASLERLRAGDVDVRATEQAAADAQAAARNPIEPLPKARDILMRDPVTGQQQWTKGVRLTKADLIQIAKRTTRQYAATEPGAALAPGIEPLPPPPIEIKVRKITERSAQGDIATIVEYPMTGRVGGDGQPVIPPGITAAPPLPLRSDPGGATDSPPWPKVQ
jgi:hypothetical protein